MTTQERLGKALNRLAAGTSVLRTRSDDDLRAERNGSARDARLEAAVARLEEAAEIVWEAIDLPPQYPKPTPQEIAHDAIEAAKRHHKTAA